METFTVRQLRTYLGLSIPEMAEKMNMHPNTYRNKEIGKSHWNIDEAAKLLKISGMDSEKVKF